MRGKRHSDETRAAVTAALLAGQSVTEVATAYHLDLSVVSRIRSGIPATKLQEVASKKEARIDQLLCDYLTANLITLRKQAEFFRNEEWLQKQSAAEVATLHGVMADKAVRLLEAAANAGAIPGGAPTADTGGQVTGASDTSSVPDEAPAIAT